MSKCRATANVGAVPTPSPTAIPLFFGAENRMQEGELADVNEGDDDDAASDFG
jgi:hypothetical protein